MNKTLNIGMMYIDDNKCKYQLSLVNSVTNLGKDIFIYILIPREFDIGYTDEIIIGATKLAKTYGFYDSAQINNKTNVSYICETLRSNILKPVPRPNVIAESHVINVANLLSIHMSKYRNIPRCPPITDTDRDRLFNYINVNMGCKIGFDQLDEIIMHLG